MNFRNIVIILISTFYLACSPELIEESTGGNGTGEYTVTFNANEGQFADSKTESTEKVNFGDTVSTPATNPTRIGYVFKGWYYDKDGISEFSTDTPIGDNITIYAVWTIDTSEGEGGGNTTTQYTVTFLASGGLFSDTTNEYKQTVSSGQTATAPVSDPLREGYTFDGWYYDIDGKYQFVPSDPILKNTIIYAVWVELTEEQKEDQDNSTQGEYSSEAEGAPARPTWIDAMRHYQELEFLKKGRYVLVWRKDPGDTSLYADRWELHQILFNDPTAMNTDEKWGNPINVLDIKETKILLSQNNLRAHSYDTEDTITLPNNLLPPDTFSSLSSEDIPAIEVIVAAKTQVGYKAITTADNSRQLVVAYKVRVFRTVTTTNDLGEEVQIELYNDSTVLMVNYKEGKYIQITGSSTGGGGSTSSEYVADTITSMEEVRAKLGFSVEQNFTSNWESNKVTGTAPIEELLTEADFEALFPAEIGKQFHDKDRTYFTWDNFVEASRYFPKLFAEGTKEDRYRELAAFLGNKSHETGEGWVALGADRWRYGMVWIVELSALIGSGLPDNPSDKKDLYKAYMRDSYYDSGSQYIGPPGKSYHGRGPVQLSWNYNYGAMSENLFGDSSILLENPNLVARSGLIGYASALWFWMQPQGNKPSAHDVMVGNVDLSDPYDIPTSRDNRTVRNHTVFSKGALADGTVVSYKDYVVPSGLEIGFGATINIINGGLEANTGKIDNRQARRTGYFARYLDYFGTVKNGRSDGKKLPISPEVGHRMEIVDGQQVRIGGDSVPFETVEQFKQWKTWIYLPEDGNSPDGNNEFPTEVMPSIISAIWQAAFY